MSTSSSDESYFDRHTTGLGYVKRVREVKPKKGQPFLACTIASFNGPKSDVEYHYYDCNVVGTDAMHLIRRCIDAANDPERKVLIGYVLGDDWVEPFIYTVGPKTGKAGFWRKARLLFVSWIKVDGKLVYKAERKTTGPSAEDPSPSADDPCPAEGREPSSDSQSASAPASEPELPGKVA